MRFRIDPRDVPQATAARRLGMSAEAFAEALPNLVARGFPKADPDTGNFDLEAVDRWCDQRHPHLFASSAAPMMGAKHAADVVTDRIAALRAGNG
jgi:hypothetical protein